MARGLITSEGYTGSYERIDQLDTTLVHSRLEKERGRFRRQRQETWPGTKWVGERVRLVGRTDYLELVAWDARHANDVRHRPVSKHAIELARIVFVQTPASPKLDLDVFWLALADQEIRTIPLLFLFLRFEYPTRSPDFTAQHFESKSLNPESGAIEQPFNERFTDSALEDAFSEVFIASHFPPSERVYISPAP